MKASTKLGQLDTPLEVRVYKNRLAVYFRDCQWTKDYASSTSLTSAYWGGGISFEEACQDLLDGVSGKILIFHQGKDNEYEVRVLG